MTTFAESGLKPEILNAINDLGFENPTPIQQKSIPLLLESEIDLIASAQTGTGKTAAFSLPLIHHTNIESKKVQTIVLCPTRELCLQIGRDMKSYSKFIKGFNVITVYGGTSIDTQIKELRRGGQVVVGTPGRTLDLINRRKLDLSEVRWVVLDEADEMLSMGFMEDLDAILAATPEEKQTLLFSATMPKEIVRLSKKYLTEPQRISTIDSKVTSSANVSHAYYVANARDRYLALKRIVDVHPSIYGIIFCRTRRDTKTVAEQLAQDGYSTDALHGDLSQAQRDFVMNRFRKKQVQLLVATDVAARGLDVNDLSHVINYNLPDELDVYVHRSGRTGRAESLGVSVAIITGREVGKIRMLERKIGKKMEQRQIPSGKDICKKQLFKLIDTVEKVSVDETLIGEFMPEISQKLEGMSREDLIKHFVSVEFNRFLAYYKNAKDLNVSARSSSRGRDRDFSFRDRDRGRGGRRDRFRDRDGRRDRNDRRDRRDDRDRDRGGRRDRDTSGNRFVRFFINVGSKNKLSPKSLLNLINQNTPNESVEIGKIEILKNFSFFEVTEPYTQIINNALNNVEHEGEKIVVEQSNNPKPVPERNFFKEKKKKKGKKKKKKW